MAQSSSRPGIECPKCGHGTYVAKTNNFVSWIQRIRTCQNPRCRHSFDTQEKPVSSEDLRRDLFSNAA